MEMAATNPLVSLPVEIFSNILEYLGWGDVGRLDTAFLNRETRNGYLFALQLREVKVEGNMFWRKALDRGILSWLTRRNIRVISWDLGVDKAQLISIANGLPQLQSLDTNSCKKTWGGRKAVCPLRSKNKKKELNYCKSENKK